MNNLKSSNINASGAQFLRLTVTEDADGDRLDRWLARHPDMVSREMVHRLMKQGEVLHNTRPGKPAAKISPGDIVEVRIPPPKPSSLEPFDAPLTIVFEDDALAVVDKPAGLAMHPSAGHSQDTLVHRLLAHCGRLSGIGGEQRPGIVHRLDKDTSGLVVIAKHDLAHQHLANQFKARTIQRTYQALVTGIPKTTTGKIDLPLGRSANNPMKRAVREDGKRAVTHWELLEKLPPFALLRLKLETGRTHQIRVHLGEKNLPVVGDPSYGGKRYRGMKLPDLVAQALEQLHRQALHAVELGFEHPETGKALSFFSPLPPDLETILVLLRGEEDR